MLLGSVRWVVHAHTDTGQYGHGSQQRKHMDLASVVMGTIFPGRDPAYVRVVRTHPGECRAELQHLQRGSLKRQHLHALAAPLRHDEQAADDRDATRTPKVARGGALLADALLELHAAIITPCKDLH